MNKLFEIGVIKTGTSSLREALKLLGFRVADWDRELYERVEKGESPEFLLPEMEKYDAFQDDPWHSIPIKFLDESYPNSKFILLDRDEDEWWNSVIEHWKRNEYILGTPFGPLHNTNITKDNQLLLKRSRHENANKYFKDRPEDLLIMNICAGDEWEKLCSFLGLGIPDKPFPKVGTSIKLWEELKKK